MNGLFPQFISIDNCKVRGLDRTWSDVLAPTGKSSPGGEQGHWLLLGLPSGEPGRTQVVRRNYTWVKTILKAQHVC